MASLDRLPPDQRAVVELILRRSQRYEQIAHRLMIDPDAVRDRAHAAMDGLAPAAEIAPDERALIADYLLGQLPDADNERVWEGLASSPAHSAYARSLATALAPAAAKPLPGLPASGDSVTDDRPRSRRGGAILLGAGSLLALAAVVVAIVVLTRGSSGRSATSTTQAARATAVAASSTSSRATSTSPARIVAQINLAAPGAQSKAQGVADVLRQGNLMGIAIAAQNLSPNGTHPPSAYAIWLYNSAADSHRLGFVNPGVGSSGRFQVANMLPTDAARYRQLIVTLETNAYPRSPGHIVLQGPLTLG